MDGAPARSAGVLLASRLALPAGDLAGRPPALTLEPGPADVADTLAAGASERADSLAAMAPDSADTLAGAASPPAMSRPAWPHVLVRSDLLQHASLSFTLAAGLTVLFRDHAAAAGVTLGLGVAKEIWDSRHRGADALDLIADVLGVGAALLTVPERGDHVP